jgi:hypothetical protein
MTPDPENLLPVKDIEMTWDEEAGNTWDNVIYPQLTSEDNPSLARGEVLVSRLAMTYAILDGENVIRTVHLRAALAFANYTNESFRWIFGNEVKTGNTNSDRIAKYLKKKGKVGAGVSEMLGDVFNRHLSKADLEDAIQILVDLGLARKGKGVSSGGRIPDWVWWNGI